jgi:hypothetical protein
MAEKRRARSEITVPTPAAGANAWESGQTPQLAVNAVGVRNGVNLERVRFERSTRSR